MNLSAKDGKRREELSGVACSQEGWRQQPQLDMLEGSAHAFRVGFNIVRKKQHFLLKFDLSKGILTRP